MLHNLRNPTPVAKRPNQYRKENICKSSVSKSLSQGRRGGRGTEPKGDKREEN